MFEGFSLPGLHIVEDPVLTAYGFNASTGIVIDIGYEYTCTRPFCYKRTVPVGLIVSIFYFGSGTFPGSRTTRERLAGAAVPADLCARRHGHAGRPAAEGWGQAEAQTAVFPSTAHIPVMLWARAGLVA